MGYRDLHFEPAVGPDGTRLRHVENHLVRQGATLTAIERERESSAVQQSQRVSKVEKAMQGVLVWVGAQKVKWGVVSFVTAILAAVATAVLTKWLGG